MEKKMSKPEEEQKNAKPKGEEKEAGKAKKPADDNMKVIIINLVSTVLVCVLFISVNYILQSSLLSSKLANLTANQANADSEDANADGGDSGDEVQKGFILDLGDFVLNLADATSRKYLKVNVALEVSNKPEDEQAAASGGEGKKSEGGEGGEGGGAAASSPLEQEMAQYKPAIRDAIITTLSSKTSTELATVAGKELAKEQIAEAVNGIFAGERDVIRVSFGQFIIQ